MSEQSKTNIRTKSSISKKLMGRNNVSTYGAKLNELSKIAGDVAPEGSLFVILLERGDSFSPMARTVKNVMDLDNLFSLKHLQMNPALATDYAEVAEHMKAIDRIITKRRKSLTKFNKPKREDNNHE